MSRRLNHFFIRVLTFKTISKNSPSNCGVIQILPVVVIGLLIITIGFLADAIYDDFNKQELESEQNLESRFKESWVTPTPILSPKPAVKGKYDIPTPTPDPDPIVDCQFTYLPWQKMKTSECSKSFECQIGGQWYIYTSRDKCKQDQSTYWLNYYKGNYYVPNYTFPTYTYTPAPLPTYQPLPTPTLSEEKLQIIIDQLEADIKHCKNEVHSRYNDLVRGCSIKYQGSAVEACERAYNKEREKELQKCEGY